MSHIRAVGPAGALATGTRASSSRSGSSAQWLARQARDPFVRARNTVDPNGGGGAIYVARSAYKLLELNSRLRPKPLLRPGMVVVDLGAAPGGWTQVAARLVRRQATHLDEQRQEKSKQGLVVAIDLLPLAEEVAALPGVVALQGDFLLPETRNRLASVLRAASEDECESIDSQLQIDLVLSDMLANMSGNPLRDSQLSVDLCEAALSFALAHLRRSQIGKGSDPSCLSHGAQSGSESSLGNRRKAKKSPEPTCLVMKCLQSETANEFVSSRLHRHFRSVRWDKPRASRLLSREAYLVCAGLRDPPEIAEAGT